MRHFLYFVTLVAACGGSGAGSDGATTTAQASTTSSKSPYPEACSLLTQAEAESVLGTLVRAPYPDSTGQGCAYETAGQKKFIVTPEWTYGKFQLDTERMVGGLVAIAGMDQGAAADTLEGPWDEAALGVQDAVFRVKARALTLHYVNSGTDLAGAVKLAGPALRRMAAVPEPERAKIASDKCPLPAETVTEILGQEVRVAPGQSGRQDACDFELALDPTVHVELKVQPENLGEMVFDAITTRAKGFGGEGPGPTKIDVGEGGLSWESKGGGAEAAARANGKVYYARLAVGITSSASMPEGAIVKLVERMMH